MPKDPTCIELFAGAGGASLGLRRAGFRSVLAAEWDADACETHRRADFGPVWEGDVRDLDAELDLIEPPTMLWASPPCQAFSSAGRRRGAMDDRNGWPWTLDIIDKMEVKGVKPTWVICENVPGLSFHRGDCPRDEDADPFECPGCYWERWIVPEFAKRYAWHGYRTLDAADFGVPQRRNRVFLVCGPQPIEWPTPTHTFEALVYAKWLDGSYWGTHGLEKPSKGPSAMEAKVMGVEMMFAGPPEGTKPWVTVRDALGLGYPIRHQSPTAAAIQHLPDELAPAVSRKMLLYAEAEVQEDPKHNPAYHAGDKGTKLLERNSGQRKLSERSMDEPAPTVLGGSSGGGYDRLQVFEGDPIDHPEAEFLSQVTPDPKHPSKSVDEPATGIRAGGDGHDSPHYWVQAPKDDIHIRQESTGSKGRTVDEPAHPVTTSGMVYLHDGDPGGRDQKLPEGHPDRRDRKEAGGDGDVVIHRQRGANTPGKPRRDHGMDEPSPTVDGGDARCGPRLEVRVIGGGHNPNSPEDAANRRYRDLTDEPSTTISTQMAGNVGPKVVALEQPEDGELEDEAFLSYLHGDSDKAPVDGPAPTIRAGGNRSGVDNRVEGGKAPYLVQPGADAVEEGDLDVFDMFGEPEEGPPERRTAEGHRVTVSRTGRTRIEYDLQEAPENPRGPSDLVRRHEVVDPDAPSTSLRTGKPEYMLGEDGGGTMPEMLDRPSAAVMTTDAKGTRGKHMLDDDGQIKSNPDRASDSMWLATGRRRLTVEECAILQGFPNDYPFQGNSTSKYRQVGNAVAPPVAEALGRAVLEAEGR